MAKPYRARNKRIIMRQPNGRFRRANLQDIGIPKSSLQDGPAICANCGYGTDAWWHPILKTGFCPKCNSQDKMTKMQTEAAPVPQRRPICK